MNSKLNLSEGETYSTPQVILEISLIIIYLSGERSNYTTRHSPYILDNYSMHILTIRRENPFESVYLLYCKYTQFTTQLKLE